MACWRRSVGTREYLGVKSHIVPCLCMTPVRCGEGAGKEDGQSRDTQTFLHVCFHYLPPAQQYIYCQTVQTSEGILTIKSCLWASLVTFRQKDFVTGRVVTWEEQWEVRECKYFSRQHWDLWEGMIFRTGPGDTPPVTTGRSWPCLRLMDKF